MEDCGNVSCVRMFVLVMARKLNQYGNSKLTHIYMFPHPPTAATDWGGAIVLCSRLMQWYS